MEAMVLPCIVSAINSVCCKLCRFIVIYSVWSFFFICFNLHWFVLGKKSQNVRFPRHFLGPFPGTLLTYDHLR